MGEVASVRREGGLTVLETDAGDVRAQALVIAAGSSFATLGIPGEAEFVGKGLSHCASCDGSFFMGQSVAVVGGGDAAIDEAVHLTQYASQVTVIHRATRSAPAPPSRSARAATPRSSSAGMRRYAPSRARRACSVSPWKTSGPASARPCR